MSDIGETTRSINKRSDDMAWVRVLKGLQDGGFLQVHRKIGRVAVHGLNEKHKSHHATISMSRVRSLERAGVLSQVGVDKYVLTEDLEGFDLQIQSSTGGVLR